MGLTLSMKWNSLKVHMELKDFKKFIKGKPVDKLLHRARRESLSRILAGEKELGIFARKASPNKRAVGTR